MFYERELHFLCNTFRKCHVQVTFATPNDPTRTIVDKSIEPLFEHIISPNMPLGEFLGEILPRTMYKLTDTLKLTYFYFLLPDTEKNILVFLGPSIQSSFTQRQVIEIGEKNGIQPKNLKYLEEYYSSVPVIAETSHLFVLLDTFAELIWGISSFSVIDINKELYAPASPINNEDDQSEDLDEILVNLNLMEKRYKFENELIQAVSLGHMHKVNTFLPVITEMYFEKRTSDPLRNTKNYCVIMNTLLRKAAENGGVHPVYLNSVSSSYAYQVEQAVSNAELTKIMGEMLNSYCRLVRKHSMKNYSPIVQKAIIFIESDLSANLSLSSLASIQNVSPGYLATVFKKETGKTVIEYIRDKRIKHAVHLLSTTHLQIQTIALHCGIMDVQYFSKIFKKIMGKTPKEYRESIKQHL